MFDRAEVWAITAVCALFALGMGYLVYIAVTAPRCLEETNCRQVPVTTYILVGKVMIPQVNMRTMCDCVRYEGDDDA